MKFIHTADWHLGNSMHDIDRMGMTEVMKEAIRIAGEYGDGFEKIYQRLRHDGYPWNHKKVYRVYKKIHFNKRSKLKKRLPVRVKEPLEAPL